jgi:small subunit ribosomal protein S1
LNVRRPAGGGGGRSQPSGSPQRRHFTSGGGNTPDISPLSSQFRGRQNSGPAGGSAIPPELADSSDLVDEATATAPAGIAPELAQAALARDTAALHDAGGPTGPSEQGASDQGPVDQGPVGPGPLGQWQSGQWQPGQSQPGQDQGGSGPGRQGGPRRGRQGRRGRPEGGQDPSTEELRVALPPKPNRREKLSADMEAEFEAAFGGRSVDTMFSDNALTVIGKQLEELDSRRSATVARVHGDNVFFLLGGRNEGVASVRQFATPPEPGQMYDVIIKAFNAEDGLYELHIPGASIEVSDWADLSEGAVVEAIVTAANTGGLECTVNKIRGFIPMSQVAIYRIENAADFIGQRLLCVVTEANPQRRNLVLSRRAVLEREKEEAKRKFYEELQIGQVREGVVRKIEDFGAFVDLDGADGLIHVSQMSWERVKDPRELLKVGQKVQVRVEKFEPQTGKIGLSLRSLQENPWTDIDAKFPIGSTVRGVVSRIANFGAFVKLAPGVEGLVHISELSNVRVSQVTKVVQEGQEVEVKVLTVDRENQKIGLSLKAAQAPPPKAEAKEVVEEPARKPAIKKRPGPLKGGFDRGDDAQKIGLNW